MFLIKVRDDGVTEIHMDAKASRMLGGALVRAEPWGSEEVDLGGGKVVRVVVHGDRGFGGGKREVGVSQGDGT